MRFHYLLPALLACASAVAAQQTNDRQRQMGDPFRTVFPITGLEPQWWVAEYDHPADWFQTAWRETSVNANTSGLGLGLAPTATEKIVGANTLEGDDGVLMQQGLTSKAFTSGQVQRRRWYGYGRYEVIMQPAVGDGLISAFYVYTGPHFGDTHEEIDIEFLGRDTNRIHINIYRDGQPLAEPIWMDLGFDSATEPRLYGFEWREDALIWFAGDTELYRITDPDLIPRPPAKIYLDLWAGGKGLIDWAGQAQPDTTANALFQCTSYTPINNVAPQCSDLLSGK